ncbi:MAG TPA: LytTR family transcriptional regulator DNA-binding domain-containing protein, partial [Erysipelothrix sp.]
MRVQLSKGLDKETILKSIDQIEIVDDGDYLLIPKKNRIVLKDTYGEVCVNVIDIDYIESLKDVIFVYANGVQYESNLKLYQYSEISLSLLRISKSVVVNK